MITKAFMIGLVLAGTASLPIAVPMAAGIPVALALGPVTVSYDRVEALDLGLDAACFSTDCPLVELRYGTGQDAMRISF